MAICGKNRAVCTMNIFDITQRGIESILKEAEKAANLKKTDKTSIAMANYRINAVAVYTIAEQVLAVIRNNDLETAQLFYNHLKGKLREIKEGFSKEYEHLTAELENILIGQNSPIAQEFKIKGILK